MAQATLGTVKCFLGLSYDRAYKRFYPAIDPLASLSRVQANVVDPEHMAAATANVT